jgi:hypothetical protein
MFQKRIRDITAEDIQQLLKEEWPESFDLELKSEIPTEKGEPDRWERRGDGVGPFGRDKILREIVAFSNAQGGTLILGILESNDDPKRAVGKNLLARCAELAERFALMIRDNIEPRLAFVECKGIPLSEDGKGVVIIRVPTSKLGPHWVVSTRDATIRRGARSESMTMSEIQDLTLKLARDADATERESDRRSDIIIAGFDQKGSMLETLVRKRSASEKFPHAMGVGLVAMPLVPILLRDVISDDSLRPHPSLANGIVKVDGVLVETPSELNRSARWRPILRGIRLEELWHWRELTQQGIIEIGALEVDESGGDDVCLFYVEPVLWAATFALLWIERLRKKADAPDLPFALSITYWCAYHNFAPALISRRFALTDNRFPNRVRPPLYKIASRETFAPLLQEIANDFFNAGGDRFTASLEASFDVTHT